MEVVPVFGRIALRVLVALAIALAFFPLIVTAFHPYAGLIDGFRHASLPEKYFALAGVTVIFAATLWRLLRGSKVMDELRRVGNSLKEPAD